MAQAPVEATAEAAVEEVVVTGSRLQTGFTAPTPVTVVGQAQVEQRAPSSIGEVVNQLPVFRNTAGPQTSLFGIVASGQAILDLRGLGGNRTLVLVNSQRHVPVNSNGTFDTNLLPTSLVERFDVVTGGASAAYGSDAVAGVTNFILANRLNGVKGSVQFGQSQRNDMKEAVVSLGYGNEFAGGKGHYIIGADYSQNDGITNMLDRSWGRNEPGFLALTASRPAGTPANLFSNYVEFNSRTAGGIVNTGPLKGTAFGPNGVPYQFAYTPLGGSLEQVDMSQRNYGDQEFNQQQLWTPYNRHAFLARAEYELAPNVTGFVAIHQGGLRTTTSTLYIPAAPNFIIDRDNPYLDAATRARMVAANLQTISVNRTGKEWGFLASGNRLETLQANFGLNGSFGDNWKWDVGGTYGGTNSHISLRNTPRTPDLYASAYAMRNAAGQIVCGPTASIPGLTAAQRAQVSPGCVPMNILGPGSISPAAVAYFNSASNQDNEIRQTTAQANLAGEPFNMPAGPVSGAIGVEWRKDSNDATGCPDCVAGKLANQNYPSYSASVTVKEAYAEVGVPLLRDLAIAKTLDLNGAVRRTDYSTSGGVTTWKIGATWEPSDFLRVRATRSRDIRAPNIEELFNPGSNGIAAVVNRTNGASASVASSTRGNPNLTPEIADTFTTGVVFQPRWAALAGFRASVDYFKIDIADVIGSVTAQDIADRCLVQNLTEYCAFLVRDSSLVGFNRVNATRINLAAQFNEGLDYELAYRVPLDRFNMPGQLDIRALGTQTKHLRSRQLLPNGTISTVDVAGAVNASGSVSGVPKWQWNFNLNYTLNRFATNLQVRYSSDIKYSTTLIGPDDPAYSPALPNSVNQNIWTVPPYYNLNMSYNIIDEPESNRRLQLFGVIDNLLDKDPPIVALEVKGGSPYDVAGRRFKVGLRFNF